MQGRLTEKMTKKEQQRGPRSRAADRSDRMPWADRGGGGTAVGEMAMWWSTGLESEI